MHSTCSINVRSDYEGIYWGRKKKKGPEDPDEEKSEESREVLEECCMTHAQRVLRRN